MHNNIPDTDTVSSETKRSPGGQIKTFDLDQRREIQLLAGWGMPQSQIATFFQCDPKTLRKHCRAELKLGAAEANKTVLQSLFNMAVSQRHSGCTIFWAKTRCRFGQQPSPKAPRIAAPRVPRSLENLTVHLNDGAPNGDF